MAWQGAYCKNGIKLHIVLPLLLLLFRRWTFISYQQQQQTVRTTTDDLGWLIALFPDRPHDTGQENQSTAKPRSEESAQGQSSLIRTVGSLTRGNKDIRLCSRVHTVFLHCVSCRNPQQLNYHFSWKKGTEH